MRILTVRQPWAWAIVHGGKDVENRVRNIAGDYRGPVAIHAAKAWAGDPWQMLGGSRALADAHRVARDSDGLSWPERHRGMDDALGSVIGVVDLVDVHDAGDCWNQDLLRLSRLRTEDRVAYDALPDRGPGGLVGKVRMCSQWALDDHHHLVLGNPRALREPIPFKGALGLRRLDDDMVARIEGAIA